MKFIRVYYVKSRMYCFCGWRRVRQTSFRTCCVCYFYEINPGGEKKCLNLIKTFFSFDSEYVITHIRDIYKSCTAVTPTWFFVELSGICWPVSLNDFWIDWAIFILVVGKYVLPVLGRNNAAFSKKMHPDRTYFPDYCWKICLKTN